jgi:hypothetical protein
MGFLDKLAKALNSSAVSPKQTSSGLAYAANGGLPQRDHKNRVVVKLAAGQQIIFGVNKQHVSESALVYLMGKPKEDDEVARSVRARIMRDTESEYPNGVIIETPKGDLIGWILKSDSELACKILDQLTVGAKTYDPNLQNETFAFDVSIRVTGYVTPLDEVEDPEDMYDLDDLEIRIKDPVEMEVEASK